MPMDKPIGRPVTCERGLSREALSARINDPDDLARRRDTARSAVKSRAHFSSPKYLDRKIVHAA